jgi:gamma-glutamylcyclotransferase (GGCT)/AIG2-like uncharacterized protein YtfP
MCLIIHKPKAGSVIPEQYITNAETINPDGFGITYLDGIKPETHITMDYDKARSFISQQRPYVAHYRYATVGDVNDDNCHPFKFNGNYLYSNGTVANLGNKKQSDTKIVSQYLSKIPSQYWHMVLSMTDTRFAIVKDNCRVKRYGEWHVKDDIYYSKANCFFSKKIGYNSYYNHKGWDTTPYDIPVDDSWDDDDFNLEDDFEKNHFIAVYGTLKHGECNNDLISGSNFIGTGQTADAYPMQYSIDAYGYKGIPYVYDDAGTGHQIQVEVYEVNDDLMREDIDILEGHPTHYTRKQVDIQLDNDEIISAWLYFAAHKYHLQTNQPMQSVY